MTAYPSLIQISDLLNAGNATRIDGEGAYDLSGVAVAGGGDVNGDGFDDILIGAIGALGSSGAGYVVFGSGGLGSGLDLTSLDGTNGFQLNGAAAGDRTGIAVANTADLNGDGLPDFVIGAYGAGPNGPLSGASYVVFGQTGAVSPNVELSGLNGTDGFKLSGEAFMDFSGRSVSDAGDVNGDGFSDVIVGAYRASPNGKYSGDAYVVFGGPSGFASNIELSDLSGLDGFRIEGAAAYDKAGLSVAGGCDINGDGFDDLFIGAEGRVYVVFGKASGFEDTGSIDLGALLGSQGFTINTYSTDITYSEPHVACAGDVNGDGIDDLVIGDPLGSDYHSGTTYVVFGRKDGFAGGFDVSDLDGSNGFAIYGEADHDYSGRVVAGHVDVNGDGFDDVIIAAERAGHNGAESGSVYVVFGHAGGFAAQVSLSKLDGNNGYRIDGAGEGDLFGSSVSTAGDVDGDGLLDVVVGAAGVATNGNLAGATYVIHGMKPQEAVNRTGTSHDDHIIGSNFNDVLKGQGGDDWLIAFGGRDSAFCGLGNDFVECGGGADTTYCGAGDDTAYGDAGNDRLLCQAGDDLALGGLGLDTVIGGGGNDTARGGAGADVLKGNGGNDQLVGQGGNDTAAGGSGKDVLKGNAGNDRLLGNGGNDTAAGGSGNDVIGGGGGDDAIDGGGGNDDLRGGDGADDIKGGPGSDTLNGGRGNDLLFGGKGPDVFIYNDSGGHDTIADLSSDDSDRIDLSGQKQIINFDDLVTNHLATDSLGFALIVIDEANSIDLSQVSVDDVAHNPLLLSVFVFEPPGVM